MPVRRPLTFNLRRGGLHTKGYRGLQGATASISNNDNNNNNNSNDNIIIIIIIIIVNINNVNSSNMNSNANISSIDNNSTNSNKNNSNSGNNDRLQWDAGGDSPDHGGSAASRRSPQPWIPFGVHHIISY